MGDAKLARGNFKGTFGKYSSRLRTKGEQEQQERRKSSPDQSDLVNESRKEEGGKKRGDRTHMTSTLRDGRGLIY